ncbi:MAG: carbohydrate ABC transporter permease [Oscillospiraceae bacterium]|nr:carbohydrate ABC transporter permease [Oscillospiraceae bacterium]
MLLRRSKINVGLAIVYLFVAAYTLACLIPMLLVVGGSFQDESEIALSGYRIIPTTFSLAAYTTLFRRGDILANAYRVTITVTLAGTFFSMIVSSMLAYALSIRQLKLHRALSVYTIVTIVFNGGMVPWYIVCVNYLNLRNSMLAMIIPPLCSAFNVFLLRNYFYSLPIEMSESARIDGAGDLRIFWQIILPLSTPVLASVSLFICLMYWNDWWHGLMLVDRSRLQPLQLMLRQIVSNVLALRSDPTAGSEMAIGSIPTEGVKLATCCVTIGPIILVYPFVQRYFISGIMIGAVKG